MQISTIHYKKTVLPGFEIDSIILPYTPDKMFYPQPFQGMVQLLLFWCKGADRKT